jgi:translation initiation factor 1 (eIF-1/SUI1)
MTNKELESLVAKIREELKGDGIVNVSFTIERPRKGRVVWKVQGFIKKELDDQN